MTQTIAGIAVVAATISTAVFLVPQVTKLIRTKNASGVSSTWSALGLVVNVGWLAYMISQGLWLGMLAPLVTLLSYGAILWCFASIGHDLRSDGWVGMTWASLLVVIAIGAGWNTLGVALGLSYIVQLSPSIWTAYATRDPSGISPSTWMIGMIEAALWGIYGLFHTDTGIMTFAVVGITGSAMILGRYYVTRRPARALA